MAGMSFQGKHQLKGVKWGPGPSSNSKHWPKIHQKQAVKSQTPLSEADLYHNPDPLFRLIGKPNESEVFVDGKKVTALIDSGSQISSISCSLAKTIKLEIKSLKTILDLEATGGFPVPYLGYIEIHF